MFKDKNTLKAHKKKKKLFAINHIDLVLFLSYDLLLYLRKKTVFNFSVGRI
jgi:hypothetical protein